jgi:hypothetical protein
MTGRYKRNKLEFWSPTIYLFILNKSPTIYLLVVDSLPTESSIYA